jgi:dipeptidyl aminopeptidase/acylaminoacyl peptidase
MKRMGYASNHAVLAGLTGLTVLAGALLASCAGPQKQGAGSGEAPPLIDRALFFGDPVTSGGQISPDGTQISFLKPYKGVRNIWVMGIDQSLDQARPVTADTQTVFAYFWSWDSRYLLYVQDKGGNEDFHIYAVDPAAAPDPATGVPPARDLTPIEGVRAMIYAVPRNAPGTMLVGLNDRDPALHDVYRIDIPTGQRALVRENTENVLFWSFDQDGDLHLAARQTGDGGQEILRVDGEALVPIYTTTVQETAFPLLIHPDGKRAYLQTSKGDDVDLARLALMDMRTGQTEALESDPESQVDLETAIFDPATDELLATVYVGDRQRIYPKNDAMRRDLEALRSKLPDGDFDIASTTRDMSVWLVSVYSDVEPGSMYVYRRAQGEVSLLYRSRPEMPSEHLAPMRPVRYPARDGLEIPAYLTLPRGVPAEKLPVVIHPHGGPWARDHWGPNPIAQFLANRGYAVLQPNFRSSTGYGKKFLNAGDRTWGTGAMQHDITDGVKWLIAQGIADPARVCIFGGSYGGYASLAGVAFTPELFKCSVPYVAPSSLVTLIESFPAYWRPFLQGTFYARVGDPAVPEDRKDLEARSPLNFVDRIRAPLLLIHGANDPRVKQAESDQIIVALREKGQAVEYIVAPDEGHGFRSPENRMAMAVALERFLAKHLGGRQQEDVPPAVAERLAAITVDVAGVKLPDRSGVEAAMRAPLPAADGSVIEPAELTYAVTMEMGPQKASMTMKRTIATCDAAGKRCWRISDVAKSPMGEMSDDFDVDRTTLRPLRRTANSGPAKIELAYADQAITGTMSVMGQRSDVNVPLAAPVIGDGPGLELAIAGLPLAQGYRTIVRYLDVASQKVHAFELVVTGVETVTVPAGKFETFVLEMRPLGDASGGGVVRVLQQAPHHVITGDYALPASMGGGKMRTELTARK